MYIKNKDNMYLSTIREVPTYKFFNYIYWHLNIDGLFQKFFNKEFNLPQDQLDKIKLFYHNLYKIIDIENERMLIEYAFTPTECTKKAELILNPKNKLLTQIKNEASKLESMVDYFEKNQVFLRHFKTLCSQDIFQTNSATIYHALIKIQETANSRLLQYNLLLNSVWIEEKQNINQNFNSGFIVYIKTNKKEGFLNQSGGKHLNDNLPKNPNQARIYNTEKELLENIPDEVKFSKLSKYYPIKIDFNLQLENQHFKISEQLTNQLELFWGEQKKSDIQKNSQTELFNQFLNEENLESKFKQFLDKKTKKVSKL